MGIPSKFNLLDGHFYDDPWDSYLWLRNQPTLWWDEQNRYFVAARHEDVVHISTNPKRYSSADGVVADQPGTNINLITMDDPEHSYKRRFVSRGFTPRRVRELGEHIREITTNIIDEIEGKGECDFVADLAAHVPLWVIAEMLGFDPEQRLELYEWSDAMMSSQADKSPEAMQRSGDAFAAYAMLCQQLIDERTADPEDDIISLLVSHTDELRNSDKGVDDLGVESLNSNELLMFLVLLMVAGNETTRNAIAGGLLALRDHPEERQKLLDDPSLIDLAVDEIVRFVSPVLSFYRTVTEDHTYRGTDLKVGDRVLMLYQSANRDETVFDEPNRLILDRNPNPQVGFGIGAHYCLGANLARVEIKVVFEELMKRLPDINVAPGVEMTREANTLVLALSTLPAVFTPVRTPA